MVPLYPEAPWILIPKQVVLSSPTPEIVASDQKVLLQGLLNPPDVIYDFQIKYPASQYLKCLDNCGCCESPCESHELLPQ